MYEFFVCFYFHLVGYTKKVEKMHMGMEEVGLLGRSVGCLCLGLGLVGWVRRSLSLFLDWETCEHASKRATSSSHLPSERSYFDAFWDGALSRLVGSGGICINRYVVAS